MSKALLRTWVAVLVAVVAVLAACVLTLRSSYTDVFPECRGRFVPMENGSTGKLEIVPFDDHQPGNHDLRLEYPDSRWSTSDVNGWTNVRFVWQNATPMCNDADVVTYPHVQTESPSTFTLHRDRTVKNVYVVKDSHGTIVATFVKTPDQGRRFMRSAIFARPQIPLLVGLLALLSLLVAGLRARLARTYATKLHAWTEAQARGDGVVEGDNGMAIAQLGATAPGPILVDPSVLGAEGSYRAMPILEKRHVARGSHAQWRDATARRLRDARALAVIATLTSFVALGAKMLAGPEQAHAQLSQEAPRPTTATATPPPAPPPVEGRLEIQDLVVGKGSEANAGDTLSVHYVGTLPDGTEFDQSRKRGKPFEFKLGAGVVIKGWDEGVKGMKVGGQRRLTMPPSLGYGARGVPGTIPPDATLVFDVELLEIKKP